ncbi:MAG: DNA adenine methylase [Actinomycetota bacterium]|nr:DNA adenine methylase [Actinomycetota bacterium]
MIKYLGSKRRLVPVLGALAERSGATTALDLFTGTTRVARELKCRGAHVTAVDTARYAHQFARCYVETDAARVDLDALAEEVRRLDALPGRRGYVTRTFCEMARYFQPHNGMRIDAIRDAIDADHRGSPLRPLLLTSLIEAADRVDSTTGVQMAYLKRWSPRSHGRLRLRVPDLLAGAGRAVCADAVGIAGRLPPVDFAYLDPPYNQHRYFANYHVWETLVAWDAPHHYGVACKRADCRRPSTASAFNSRRAMPAALARVIASVRARLMVVSCNDEAWMGPAEVTELCAARGRVAVLGFDSRRYVGAQIGIHDPRGRRVGRVSHLRNTEYLVLSGDDRVVESALRAFPDAARAS